MVRVLVVDDDVGVRRGICRVLARHHEVEGCPDADAALEILTRREFDLLVVDLEGTNGRHLIHELRSRIPIIVLSGTFTEFRDEQLRSLHHLEKPVGGAVLLRAIDETLQTHACVAQSSNKIRRGGVSTSSS